MYVNCEVYIYTLPVYHLKQSRLSSSATEDMVDQAHKNGYYKDNSVFFLYQMGSLFTCIERHAFQNFVGLLKNTVGFTACNSNKLII